MDQPKPDYELERLLLEESLIEAEVALSKAQEEVDVAVKRLQLLKDMHEWFPEFFYTRK